MFKDISPLLADHRAFSYAIAQMHELSLFCQYDYILGVESRGLIFATALAQVSKTGLILARKPNKLPSATYQESYGLEYGSDALEIQQRILPAKAKVLIVDDILATGGTLLAAANLVNKAGAQASGALVLLEISELQGIAKLTERSVQTKALIRI